MGIELGFLSIIEDGNGYLDDLHADDVSVDLQHTDDGVWLLSLTKGEDRYDITLETNRGETIYGQVHEHIPEQCF